LRAVKVSGALIVPIAFGLLVVATVGAFFVTTRLKRSRPVVTRLTFSKYVSPNGDGRRDFVNIGFRTKETDDVTVSLISQGGDEVRMLVRDRKLRAGRHEFRWDGRLASGAVAPDGRYRVRVGLRKQGRSVISRRELIVDVTPPRPVVRDVTPNAISPDGTGTGNETTLRFVGPNRTRPTLLVYRTDLANVRLVARAFGSRESSTIAWNGQVGLGGRKGPAPPGDYLLVVRTLDAAGNEGPAGLPPRRGQFGGHPGVVARYIQATGPLQPVKAGSPVRFGVQSDHRRYRWSVRRVGSKHLIARGSSGRHALHLRAPTGGSGMFLLDLRVGRHRYQTPFAVQAKRKQHVLVVVPALTWEARNTLDTTGDGFPDVLPEDPSVGLVRPFAGGGLPPSFALNEAPLFRVLDRMRVRYDVTTDLALVKGMARPPIRYRAILFAGAPRYFPTELGGLARSYVESGGRIAWFGTGGFTSPVRLRGNLLERLPASPDRNALGERLRPRNQGLLTVLGDTIEFFRGVGANFGSFPRLEETVELPRGARILASAGSEANRPSLVVYRDGRGVVVRVGIDGFARTAPSSPEVQRIMSRLWTLLSR